MSEEEPVRLVEEASTGDRFLIYGTDAGVRVELRYAGDALWMSQAQMATLFGRDVSVISRHIANVLAEGELDEANSLQKMQTTTPGRPGVLYSLEMVISVGYRVSSQQATLFRKWATAILVQFATRGYVVDVQRLKDPAEFDRVRELREIIRDIRSSEANLYAELRRICAMCQDYDPKSDASRLFYQQTQAKLFWAVTGNTPSMILADRANAEQDNMGLRTWSASEVRARDSEIAKNYLGPSELTELNRLTDLLLTIFEDQLDMGRLTTMEYASHLLERQFQELGRPVLKHGGSISHADAEAHAKAAYKKFDADRRLKRQQVADAELAELGKLGKRLPKTPRRK